ncbi:MAG: hypothetical protein ACREUS_05490 [Burkholderiales bacterium]
MRETLWFRDRQAWRFIARRYLPWLAALNLVWEVAQLPLYTLWQEAPLSSWSWIRISIGTALTGTLYTALSEWTNTTLFRWSYSELMPTIAFGGGEIGLSPLLQWLVVPALSLYLARITRRILKLR